MILKFFFYIAPEQIEGALFWSHHQQNFLVVVGSCWHRSSQEHHHHHYYCHYQPSKNKHQGAAASIATSSNCFLAEACSIHLCSSVLLVACPGVRFFYSRFSTLFAVCSSQIMQMLSSRSCSKKDTFFLFAVCSRMMQMLSRSCSNDTFFPSLGHTLNRGYNFTNSPSMMTRCF